MTNEAKPLSNNLNALGELVERYGYPVVAKYFASIVLFWYEPEGEEAHIWEQLSQKMSEHTERPTGATV